jgi:hypothetical protein
VFAAEVSCLRQADCSETRDLHGMHACLSIDRVVTCRQEHHDRWLMLRTAGSPVRSVEPSLDARTYPSTLKRSWGRVLHQAACLAYCICTTSRRCSFVFLRGMRLAYVDAHLSEGWSSLPITYRLSWCWLQSGSGKYRSRDTLKSSGRDPESRISLLRAEAVAQVSTYTSQPCTWPCLDSLSTTRFITSHS